MRSVDGYALPIDELKGTKPVESIDLPRKGLGVASGIIIAACIKENAVLKELMCAARPFACTPALAARNIAGSTCPPRVLPVFLPRVSSPCFLPVSLAAIELRMDLLSLQQTVVSSH